MGRAAHRGPERSSGGGKRRWSDVDSERAARAASWLFVFAGVLTVVSADLPGTRSALTMRVLGIAALLIGFVIRVLPWATWHRSATLSLVVPAFVLIGVGNRYGSDAPYAYAIYFIVVFTWVGLSQPPRTSVWLAPVATLVYLLPMVGLHDLYPGATTSTVVAIPVCVLVGETVAWAVNGLHVARREADHRASLLRAVASAATSITTLDRDHVLVGVVDAATSLGFEIAAIAVFDEGQDTYQLLHARGFTPEYVARPHGGDEGVVGAVRSNRRTMAADRFGWAGGTLVARLDETQLNAAIGSPVWVRGHMAGVLLAATRASMRFTPEDVEAFGLLASHAGRALDNADRFGDERHAKEQLAEVSMRDELTGVGNRRHAMQLLDDLRPGDAVMVVDIDHFKEINDRHGHGTGDQLLMELADHLRANVRDPALVARYGGDEFVVVLPKMADHTASAVADRLLHGWHDRDPLATFSAGIAHYETGEPRSATVAKADAALYVAKRLGRDRVCEHGLVDEARVSPLAEQPS